MTTTYFAADGSYGNAADLIILDTSDWSTDEWEIIDEVRDIDRVRVAYELSLRSDDQPALPGMGEEN